jgi:hypothetical protein
MLTNYSSKAYCEKNVIKLLICQAIIFQPKKCGKCPLSSIFCKYLPFFKP